MTQQKADSVDPIAVLAYLEAKKGALEGVISSWKKALELGALGPSRFPCLPEGEFPGAEPSVISPPMELPVGMLLGKNLPDAIKLYLGSVGKKQTNKEIEAGLKEHGVESTAKRFSASVAGALFRLRKLGEIARFKDGWLLAEQLSPHMRAKLSAGNSHAAKPKPAKRRKAKVTKPPLPATNDSKGEDKGHHPGKLWERAVDLIKDHPSEEFTAKQLAERFGIHSKVISMTLARPVKQGLIRISAPGTYTSAKLSS
jgi:hypothetical protein